MTIKERRKKLSCGISDLPRKIDVCQLCMEAVFATVEKPLMSRFDFLNYDHLMKFTM